MSKVVKIGIMQYLKKEVSDEVDFLHSDKHQSFQKIDAIFFYCFGQTCPKYTDRFALS